MWIDFSGCRIYEIISLPVRSGEYGFRCFSMISGDEYGMPVSITQPLGAILGNDTVTETYSQKTEEFWQKIIECVIELF